ncbi:NAD(P)/FAD-dependent oxidoreductase [Frankia sp. AgB32]|uniref:NAD(P)/FAD-dependent oxidoreductase n=1 Tax=Frankia sp. AgB32 TaxID=631119 RepID=UPI00200C8E3C|nr:hypothetical protein [Frankia sp. AgB32]MCK9897090.1 hypothetical protein [Frankia sp. AgB32]
MEDDGRRLADPDEIHDVAIVGVHLASALLGAVLARHGLRVLLVDADADPLAAAGETTVPYTAEVFFTLARRFDVPEIAAFGLTRDLPEEIRRGGGVKRSLGFLYHVPGREQDPNQAVQFNVPGEHSEWHPYRLTADRHAAAIARSYGARTIRLRPKATDIAPRADGVSIVTAHGETYRARYVVDAAGPDSPLVRHLGGPDPVARLRTRSRVLSTHMSGVRPFEDCVPMAAYERATAWSTGTISHLFPGGWLQVVHFDNHAEAATPLCGVTAGVDPELFADLPKDPDVAFARLVDRFPALRRCFAEAVRVQPWAADERWQRTVPVPAGPRYFLFERSASRNDLFLSRDVTMGAEMVHALAPALLDAARRDDWSPERFAPVAGFQTELIAFNDRILAAARTATHDFALWNAFSRVWLLWSILAALSLKTTRNRCLHGGDWSDVERFYDGPYWFALPNGLPDLLDDVFALFEEVEARRLTPATAAGRVFAALDAAPFVPPLYRFADPDDRYYHFTRSKRLRMLAWSKTVAPPEFRAMLTRENLTNVPPSVVH